MRRQEITHPINLTVLKGSKTFSNNAYKILKMREVRKRPGQRHPYDVGRRVVGLVCRGPRVRIAHESRFFFLGKSIPWRLGIRA